MSLFFVTAKPSIHFISALLYFVYVRMNLLPSSSSETTTKHKLTLPTTTTTTNLQGWREKKNTAESGRFIQHHKKEGEPEGSESSYWNMPAN